MKKITKNNYLNNIKKLEKRLTSLKEIYETWNWDKENGYFWDWKENHFYFKKRNTFNKTDVFINLQKELKESTKLNEKTNRYKTILIYKEAYND